VQIIGDDLRVFHPDNARLMREDDKTAAFYTGPDSGRWVEKAIAYAKEQRFNLIIEGTMRDSNVVAATMTGLWDAGYEIDARALAVPFRLSEQGIYQRYENQKVDRGEGRMTAPEAHQAAYDGLPVTLARIESEKLADWVTIYRRGAVAIYENELRDGRWLREQQAAAVVEAERARPLTPAEAQAYRDGFDALAVLIRAPGRNATPNEIAKIDKLQAEFRLIAGPDVSPAAPVFDAARYWAQTAAEGAKIIATDPSKLGIDQAADMTPNGSRRQKPKTGGAKIPGRARRPSGDDDRFQCRPSAALPRRRYRQTSGMRNHQRSGRRRGKAALSQLCGHHRRGLGDGDAARNRAVNGAHSTRSGGFPSSPAIPRWSAAALATKFSSTPRASG
jgi:hypothetical protein